MDNKKHRISQKVLVFVVLLSFLGLSACTTSQHSILGTLLRINMTEVSSPVAVPDGTGGVYVAFQKNVIGLGRITYLQRLDAAGTPLWPGAGLKIYLDKFPGDEHLRTWLGELLAVEDGAILVWYLGEEIWAQKVDPLGNLLWGRNGVELEIDFPPRAGKESRLLRAVGDGANGVVVAANRIGAGSISLRRLDTSGKFVWSGGRWVKPLSFPTSAPDYLDLASDSAGNLFVLWTQDIFWGIQKVNTDGEPQWGPNGVIPFPAMSGFSCEQVVSDGAGGAIVLCNSQSESVDASGEKQLRLVAQHFEANGKPLWPESGLLLGMSATGLSHTYMIRSDGAGGAVAAWQRPSREVYAQRVNGEGQSLWGEQGVRVASESSFFSLDAGNEPGEALIAWGQSVSKEGNGYVFQLWAQKLNGNGTPAWATGGMAFTTLEVESVSTPLIVADGESGAWVTWTAGHSRGGHHNDTTYIQYIAADGQPSWGEEGIKLSALR